MNINTLLYIIYQVVKGTPVYVWLLFAFLISKGLGATQTKRLSLKKMLIMPVIFSLWGLDKMFGNFTNIGIDFLAYLMVAFIGTMTAYALYQRSRQVIYKNNDYYCTGSLVPLGIVLINFSVKYVLSVIISVQPSLYASNQFCLFYSIISGFSVGLFIGGWLQAYWSYRNCVIYAQVS